MFVRGGYEYVKPDQVELPDEKLRGLFKRIYTVLNYDIGFPVLPLDILGKDSINNEIPFSENVIKKTSIKTENGDIGFVVLPSKIRDDHYVRINEIIERYRRNPEVFLVIAVSSLGAKKENLLFEGHGFSPDILLGGGRGSGLRGRLKNDGETLWVRPYPEGKSINFIRVFYPPKDGKNRKWIRGENVEFDVLLLRGENRDDPEVREIFSDDGW